MHRPNPAALSDHARHDATLIARHAAGDLVDSERLRADVLLAECRHCADLEEDLLAIAAATRELPAPAAISRDFRLTPEVAARLRRGSWLRRLLGPFEPSPSAVRPLAAAFTSIGAAGLLLAAFLPGMLGSPASLGTERSNTTGAGDLPAAVAPSAPVVPVFGPAAAPGATSAPADDGIGAPATGTLQDGLTDDKNGAGASAGIDQQVAGGNEADTPRSTAGERDGTSPFSLLLVGSLALLLLGLTLLALQFAARRLR